MESEPGQPHIRLPFVFKSHLCDHAAHHRKQYILKVREAGREANTITSSIRTRSSCSSFTSTSWGPKLSRSEVDERWGSGSSSTVSSISALRLCIQHQSSASAAAGFATAGFCGSSSPLAAGMAHLLPNLGLRHVTPKWHNPLVMLCSGLAAKCAQPALAQTIPPDAVPFRQHLDTKDVSHQCHIRTAMRAWRCHLPARPTARSSIVSGISSYGRPMNELFQLHGGQSSLAMRWTKGGAGMPFHRGMQRQPKGAPASSSKTQVFRCEAHPCKDLRAQYSGWSPPLLDSCHWSAVGSLTRPHRAIHCFFWRSEATHHFWRHVSIAANHSLSPWNSRLQAQGAVLGCYELGSWPSLPAKKCGTLEHEVKRTPKTQSKVRRLGSQSVLNLQMPKYLEVKSRFETDRAWPILSCWM